MLNTHRFQRSAGRVGSGGFTLVELLVVIGIIAILAGVALGPITSGIKKAQQSGAVQSSRSIALGEFQYATDNNNQYPFGATIQPFLAGLFAGNYLSDTGMLVISGSGETKYSGANPGTSIAATNVSYDFTQQSNTQGLNAAAPDALPVVYSSVGGFGAATSLTWSGTAGTAVTATVTSTSPLGTAGVAYTTKGNSANFIKSAASASPQTITLTDATYPGYAALSVPGGG